MNFNRKYSKFSFIILASVFVAQISLNNFAKAQAQTQTQTSEKPATQVEPQISSTLTTNMPYAEGIPNQPLPLISGSFLKFYGFLKASVITSDAAIESNSFQNMVAPSAAGNPEVSQHPNWASSSFQMAQTRFGMKTEGDSFFNGLLEFDILDFSKSTPTVAAIPRIRRAFVTAKQDDWTYIIGQDWDIVSPLAPTTFNLVGHYFQSGDIGFMRLQVQALKKDQKFEHAIALGFPNNNNLSTANNYEYGLYPTLALRETFTSAALKVGVSGMIGSLKLPAPSAQKSIQPYVLTLFAHQETNGYEINTEAYYGRSLANLNLQGLSYSTTSNQLEELGGYITLKKQLNPKNDIFGGFGFSKVLTNRSLPLPWDTVKLAPTGQGPGLKENSTYRIGYFYKPTKLVQLFVEIGRFVSIRQLSVASNLDSRRTANYAEVGLKTDF